MFSRDPDIGFEIRLYRRSPFDDADRVMIFFFEDLTGLVVGTFYEKNPLFRQTSFFTLFSTISTTKLKTDLTTPFSNDSLIIR